MFLYTKRVKVWIWQRSQTGTRKMAIISCSWGCGLAETNCKQCMYLKMHSGLVSRRYLSKTATTVIKNSQKLSDTRKYTVQIDRCLAEKILFMHNCNFISRMQSYLSWCVVSLESFSSFVKGSCSNLLSLNPLSWFSNTVALTRFSTMICSHSIHTLTITWRSFTLNGVPSTQNLHLKLQTRIKPQSRNKLGNVLQTNTCSKVLSTSKLIKTESQQHKYYTSLITSGTSTT